MNKKLVIRAKDGDIYKLIHVAYIPEKIYDKFFELLHLQNRSIAECLEVWAKADNLGDYTVKDVSSLELLKSTIKNKALTSIDNTGLFSDDYKVTGSINAWITRHMKEEMEKYGIKFTGTSIEVSE